MVLIIVTGNHYGTPKPSREPNGNVPQSGDGETNVNWFMPGAHPSSEGKRRRNRSNVEAMSSKDMESAALETCNGQDSGKNSWNFSFTCGNQINFILPLNRFLKYYQ